LDELKTRGRYFEPAPNVGGSNAVTLPAAVKTEKPNVPGYPNTPEKPNAPVYPEKPNAPVYAVTLPAPAPNYGGVKPDSPKYETMVPNANAGANPNTGGGSSGNASGGATQYRHGSLPGGGHGPLAVAFIPFQESALPQYSPDDGLSRGTLFPGLDLPFMNRVNSGNPYAGTPLGELTAISFAAHELTLYLDTHTDDREAFGLLREMLALKKEARRRYTERFGPVSPDDLLEQREFNWTRSPFPWEYAFGGAYGTANASNARYGFAEGDK
jgi:spore coat protein JB